MSQVLWYSVDMKKEQIIRIVSWSTCALIIPILGQLFVHGWDWGLGDFAFAWVFFNLFGITYTFLTNKITHRKGKIVVGLGVIVVFVFVWAILATG